MGASLYVDRKKMDIVYLKDRNNWLITGDQPTSNLAQKDDMDHDDVAIYYPLCPNLAVMVTYNKLQHRSIDVSNEIVEALNETMAFNADQFLVGWSESVLKQTIKPLTKPDVLPMIISAAC